MPQIRRRRRGWGYSPSEKYLKLEIVAHLTTLTLSQRGPKSFAIIRLSKLSNVNKLNQVELSEAELSSVTYPMVTHDMQLVFQAKSKITRSSFGFHGCQNRKRVRNHTKIFWVCGTL